MPPLSFFFFPLPEISILLDYLTSVLQMDQDRMDMFLVVYLPRRYLLSDVRDQSLLESPRTAQKETPIYSIALLPLKKF